MDSMQSDPQSVTPSSGGDEEENIQLSDIKVIIKADYEDDVIYVTESDDEEEEKRKMLNKKKKKKKKKKPDPAQVLTRTLATALRLINEKKDKEKKRQKEEEIRRLALEQKRKMEQNNPAIYIRTKL